MAEKTLIITAVSKFGDFTTDERELLVRRAIEIADGWFEGRQIFWEDVWDRMEDEGLDDTTGVEIDSMASPLQTYLKSRVHDR